MKIHNRIFDSISRREVHLIVRSENHRISLQYLTSIRYTIFASSSQNEICVVQMLKKTATEMIQLTQLTALNIFVDIVMFRIENHLCDDIS